MNLKFWKKKKATGEGDGSAADETLAAKETDPTPAKPGFWARLKNALPLSRKKNETDEAEETEPPAKRKDDKHRSEEPEAPPPPKPGLLARLKSALLPSRKKKKTGDDEKSEEPKRSAKYTDKKPRDKEPEPADIPAKKPRKWLAIMLALLIPLAAGVGFFAANQFSPPPHQKAPAASDAAWQEERVDGKSAPGPAKTAEPAPQPEPEQPTTEPAPQQADNAATPAAEVPAPVEEDIPAQIEALKKQNQEMQAQIEALKKQPAVEKPARPTAPAAPRDGVLIINGQNAKESAQGLKGVIEGMNAASDAKASGKK